MALPAQSVAEAIQLTEDERFRLRDRMSLFQRSADSPVESIRSRVERFLQMNRTAVICDSIVTRWGSVAVIADASGAELVQLPHVTSTAVERWINGESGEASWSDIVQASRDERMSRRAEWAEATDRVLLKIGEMIAQPIVDSISEPHERILLLSAGFLSAIPTHAAPLGSAGKQVFEHFRGFAYVPSPAMLRPAAYDWTVRGPAICILSDPAKSETEELIKAPRELCEIADILSKSGISVTVIAGVSSQKGREVFERGGISLPLEVSVLELKPSREWLRDNLARFAHVFYTGHGVGGEGPNTGLILAECRWIRSAVK